MSAIDKENPRESMELAIRLGTDDLGMSAETSGTLMDQVVRQ